MENLQLSQSLINPQAIEVCKILKDQGYQAFIVGGCVRDLLLGTKPKDYDITTDANPQTIINIFPKTYPTGLKHGTITVAMGEGVENHFEVTTFRIEGEYKDGRRPEEVFFVMNIEQDLARRDLTINAIAYDPINNNMIDPFNGIKDLELNLIKAVGNAESRFKEDGLRIMRVARFASRFKYEIDSETIKGMKSSIETLKKVSKERIKDELSKILMSQDPVYGLQILNDVGALQIACPLLYKQKNTFNELNKLSEYNGDLTTRVALLYSIYSSKQVQEELIKLKFSSKEIKQTCFLLELLNRYVDFIQKDTSLAYKSFMATIKNHSPETWEHTFEQFNLLLAGMGIPNSKLVEYQNEIVIPRKEMKINGDDLMAIGILVGPQIKELLESCYIEILRNPKHNSKESLLEFISVK